jgi:hypothetical protein
MARRLEGFRVHYGPDKDDMLVDRVILDQD